MDLLTMDRLSLNHSTQSTTLPFRDKFIWCASGVEDQAGLTRINLGQEISSLVFAYAWDLYDSTDTLGHATTACAFLGDLNQLVFCNAGDGTDGKIYIQETDILVASATLRTGFVRYNTLENKLFKYIIPRFDTTDGGLNIDSITADDTTYTIGVFPQGAQLDSVGDFIPRWCSAVSWF
jgi:hypothetical protein